MMFAFRVCKHTKSNAIIYAKDGATVGIGAGQMSRVDSARIARRKAEDAAAALGGKAEPADDRLGVRLGRVLPVRRWPAAGGAGGRDGGDPAGRIGARR